MLVINNDMLAFELTKFSGPNILSHAKKDRQIIQSYFSSSSALARWVLSRSLHVPEGG